MSYKYLSTNWMGSPGGKDPYYGPWQPISMERQQWVEFINDGMVNPIMWAGAGKRKHGRGYEKGLRPNRVKRVREKQDKVLEQAQIVASRALYPAKMPLVLAFEYHEPSQFMSELLGFAPGDEYKIAAFWTCHTKVGTFLVVKHWRPQNKDKLYASYFIRNMMHDSENVLAIRTLPQFGKNRADSLARLCGQPWVFNMGKTYSLYELYTPVTRNGLRTSVWFKFVNDETEERTDYPRNNHIRQVFIDYRNTNTEWVWNKWQRDMRWQPRPLHSNASFPNVSIPRNERNVHIVTDKLSTEQQNFMNLI